MANAIKKTNAILDKAHTFFNKKLFGGELPDAAIILARKKGAEGYFHADRFHTEDGRKIDEIAINPDYLLQDEIKILQTVAHEMAHQWQHHFGEKKSRTAYHNAEWAAKMESIGLMPSSTSQPGGKKTGQKMGDYVIPGGLFERVVAELSADELNEIGSTVLPPKQSDPAKKKVKHTCPSCGQNGWGQRDSLFICGRCMFQKEEVHYMTCEGQLENPEALNNE